MRYLVGKNSRMYQTLQCFQKRQFSLEQCWTALKNLIGKGLLFFMLFTFVGFLFIKTKNDDLKFLLVKITSNLTKQAR